MWATPAGWVIWGVLPIAFGMPRVGHVGRGAIAGIPGPWARMAVGAYARLLQGRM